jgi:hypothetical protein
MFIIAFLQCGQGKQVVDSIEQILPLLGCVCFDDLDNLCNRQNPANIKISIYNFYNENRGVSLAYPHPNLGYPPTNSRLFPTLL